MSVLTLDEIKKVNLKLEEENIDPIPFWVERNKNKNEEDLVYFYRNDKYWSLIIDGVDVLDGKMAVNCEYYPDSSYFYETKRTKHFILNGKDLLQKINQNKCLLFSRIGDHSFTIQDKNNKHQIYTISELN